MNWAMMRQRMNLFERLALSMPSLPKFEMPRMRMTPTTAQASAAMMKRGR